MKVVELKEYRKAKRFPEILKLKKKKSLHERTISQLEKVMSQPLWKLPPAKD